MALTIVVRKLWLQWRRRGRGEMAGVGQRNDPGGREKWQYYVVFCARGQGSRKDKRKGPVIFSNK
jgi:hypothetical protein